MKPVKNYNSLRNKILAGIAETRRKLVTERLISGRPLIIWRNGKVERVSAAEFASELEGHR